MGPLGIICVAVGAILYWAVDVDVEYVDMDSLGVILMVGGIVMLLAMLVMRSRRTQGDIGVGAVLILVGAVLRWAVDADLQRLDDDSLGVILMIVGVLAVIVALTLNGSRGEPIADLSLFLIGIGAAVAWALYVDIPYVDDDALGVILVVAGLLGLAAAVILHERDRRDRRRAELAARTGGDPEPPEGRSGGL